MPTNKTNTSEREARKLARAKRAAAPVATPVTSVSATKNEKINRVQVTPAEAFQLVTMRMEMEAVVAQDPVVEQARAPEQAPAVEPVSPCFSKLNITCLVLTLLLILPVIVFAWQTGVIQDTYLCVHDDEETLEDHMRHFDEWDQQRTQVCNVALNMNQIA